MLQVYQEIHDGLWEQPDYSEKSHIDKFSKLVQSTTSIFSYTPRPGIISTYISPALCNKAGSTVRIDTIRMYALVPTRLYALGLQCSPGVSSQAPHVQT